MILNSRWKLKLKMLDLTDTLWLSCCGSNAWNCGRRYRRINQSQKRKRDFHPEVWYWGRNYRNIKQLRNGRKIHPSKFRFGLRRRKLEKLHHIWWKENGRFVRLRANFHFEVWKWSKNYRNISLTKKRRLIPPPRSRFPFRLLRWKKKSAEHQLKRMPGRFFHTCLHVHLHVWGWRWNYQNTS